jgi:hypothetical protein
MDYIAFTKEVKERIAEHLPQCQDHYNAGTSRGSGYVAIIGNERYEYTILRNPSGYTVSFLLRPSGNPFGNGLTMTISGGCKETLEEAIESFNGFQSVMPKIGIPLQPKAI